MIAICKGGNEIKFNSGIVNSKSGELKISKLHDNRSEKDVLNSQPYPERNVLYKLRKTQSILDNLALAIMLMHSEPAVTSYAPDEPQIKLTVLRNNADINPTSEYIITAKGKYVWGYIDSISSSQKEW